MRLFAPVAALAATGIAGALLFAAFGKPPGAALYFFFLEPFLSREGLTELAVKTAPLLLCGLGLSIGFRGGIWNIGAEGQFVMGAIGATGVALAFRDGGGVWVLPLMVLSGALAGAGWAAIPAFLRARFNANEILTSLMLVYIALQFLGWLVRGPWTNPAGRGFPESRLFEDWALLPILVEGTRLHTGVLFAVFAVPVAWFLVARSFASYRIGVTGLAPAAARYAGFGFGRIVWIGFLVSGGLAGLAGMAEVAGPVGQLNTGFPVGYGFAGIIVAFLGRFHPFGIALSSLLLGLTYLGGEALQIEMHLPSAVAGVFQGMLLFFIIASEALIQFRLRVVRSVAVNPES